MKYSIRIDNLIISIVSILIGLKLIYDGWMMLKHGRMILDFSEKLGLSLVRRFKRGSAASLYLEKNSRPRNIKIRGINVLIVGVLIWIVGVFFLFTGSIIYSQHP